MSVMLDIGAAIFALVAAVFWFRSAAVKLPPMSDTLDSPQEDDPFYKAVKSSAQLNKWAALFSGLSAACIVVELIAKVYFSAKPV
jgi:hypothetical protein